MKTFKKILKESTSKITLEEFKKFINNLLKSLKEKYEEYFILGSDEIINLKFKNKDEVRLVSKSGNLIIINIKNKNIKIFIGSKGAGWNSPTYDFNVKEFDEFAISKIIKYLKG